MKRFFAFVSIFLPFLISVHFSEVLTIFHAGSLTKPLNAVSNSFKQLHKNFEIRFESSGSLVVVRKIVELGKVPDIAFFADYRIFNLFLYPKFADFQVRFASNSMVLAYTENSKYSKELKDSNWYEIILRPNVKFGYSNPDLDPCGYRALMVSKLAEKYYGKSGIFEGVRSSPNAVVLKKSVDLISYLQLGELDYAFLYKSEAVSSDLKFLEFPPEINLGSEKFAENYRNAVVRIIGKSGKKVELKGEPILYSFTIPKDAKNKDGAIEFLRFLISDSGRKIFEKYGFSILEIPIVDVPENLPLGLKEVLK